MNVEQLKNSILQLAIQGKLVEQREEEGSAEELYQQIQLEKNQLIKEGKLKKPKPLPPINSKEVPFDIPTSWNWTYIREITYDLGQKTPTVPFFYIDVNSIDNNIFEVRTKKMFASNDSIPSRARKIVKPNSVIFSSVRPYLKNVAVIKGDAEEEFIVSTAFIVMHQENNILSKFLFFFLQTNFLIELLNEKMRGATYPAITTNDLLDVSFPLPPLSEQVRIVDKIEELMPLIEEYGESYVKLEELNKSFPQNIKQSILKYAIQGKLVEQREEEGSAEELYQQIQLEKNQLIKEGKLKKSKPLPPINLEEVPFEIPATWKWIRLAQISTLIQPEKISNERLEYFEARVLRGQKEPEFKLSGDVVDVGDYVILVDGENSGEVFKILKRGYIGSTFKQLFYFSKINEDYLIEFLSFYKKTFSERKIGAAIPHLNKTLFNNMPFPLPPYNEQQRIVDKIEELLSITKALEGEIQ